MVRSLRVCAIERSRSLIVNREHVTLRDIADKKIVAKNELYKTYDILKKAAKAEGIELAHVLWTSDETLLIDRISSAEYVGIGVYGVGKNLSYDDILAVPFEPSLPWNIYLSYKKHKALSTSVQLFIQFVKENYCE